MAPRPPWSPKTDPIIGPAGPPGSGLHRTASGQVVDGFGNYQHGSVAPTTPTRPARTTARGTVAPPGLGAVSLLTSGVKPKPVAKPKAARPAQPPLASTAPGAPTAPVTAAAPPAKRPSAKPPARKPTGLQPQKPTAPAAPPPDYLGDASKLVDPIYAALVDSINQRAAAGENAIKGYTTQFANVLGGYDPTGAYQGAQESQAALDSALATALAGAGTKDANDLAGKLATIGAPGDYANTLTSGVDQTGTGASNAGLAKGSASLAALIADTAHAKDYAGTLPTVAAREGLSTLKGYEGQTAQQITDLLAKKPADVLAERDKLEAQAAQKAALKQNAIIASGYDPATGQLTLAARKALAGITGVDPVTGKPTAAAAKAANAASKADTALSKAFGYLVDQQGNPIVRNGSLVKLPAKAAGATKPPTPPTLAKWTKFADDAYHGVAPQQHYDSSTGTYSPIPGTGKPPVMYYQALKQLLAMGADLAHAQKTLDAFYARGEGGRPWVSLQGRVALQQAGMPLNDPQAQPDGKQLAFLKQHGLWGP